MRFTNRLAVIGVIGFLAISSAPALAMQDVTIVIKDHKFEPSTVEVPPGEKIKLIIDNQDSTPEEFESRDLNREKIIRGNSKGVVLIGPLEEGTYSFFGEFNMGTAQGTIVVKALGSVDGEEANDVEASSGSSGGAQEKDEDLKRALDTGNSTVPVPLEPISK